MTARIEPQIVMETENVEIIKAMVRHGIGISIIPFQAVSRDVAGGQVGKHLDDDGALRRLQYQRVLAVLDLGHCGNPFR